jgi:hypothetical protein
MGLTGCDFEVKILRKQQQKQDKSSGKLWESTENENRGVQ